jgi:RNA polymerase sigma-B factor
MTPTALADDHQAQPRPIADETLLRRYAVTRDPALRERLVARYMPLARHVANRYAGGYEPVEDLLQVASVGLLKAIDRYEPVRGNAFSSYAVPTMAGEIRRHFRDRGWLVRPPRDLQDRCLAVERAAERLSADGPGATVAGVATATGMALEEVLEAMVALRSRHAVSFTAAGTEGEDGGTALEHRLGAEDPALDAVDTRVTLRRMTAILTRREREALRLRFEEDLTQAEIGRAMGVSQMQISRMVRGALERLREAGTQPG